MDSPKNERKTAPPLEEKRKKRCLARAAASSRNASPIFHKFSVRASMRVAGLRRAGTSKVWGARRDASPTAVYVTGAYWASGACAGLRASRASPKKTMKAADASALRRLALPKLESAHSKIKRGRANWQSHARNEDQVRKQRLSVPMSHFHRSQ